MRKAKQGHNRSTASKTILDSAFFRKACRIEGEGKSRREGGEKWVNRGSPREHWVHGISKAREDTTSNQYI